MTDHRREQLRKASKKWRDKYGRAYQRKWRATHLEQARKSTRTSKALRRVKEKRACIDAYGGKCSCCGEAEILFLTMDHVNNDGARHRKTLGLDRVYTGYEFYRWLRMRGYPKQDYRALCFNCNCGRHHNGGVCPHVIR